jgi:SAM-dependent methyltransferase
LYCGGKEKDKNWTDPIYIMERVNDFVVDGVNVPYSKKKWADCLLEKVEGKLLTKDPQEEIQDGTIIEFSYDITQGDKNDLLGWIPNRVRRDKTELYQNTQNIAGTANDIVVVQRTWKTILNPISKDKLVTTKKPLSAQNVSQEDDIYFNRETDRKSSLLLNMNHFHSYFVKYKALLEPLEGNSIFDIACGKGQDMSKWFLKNFEYVVGVDISRDNIYNPEDGIYRRYIDSLVKAKQARDQIPHSHMIFLILDAAKEWNWKYFKSFENANEQETLMTVWGLKKKNEIQSRQLLLFYNIMARKFPIVTCNFAIHYFCENESTFDIFLKNVNSVLRPGGYFVGTNMDGDRVTNYLSDIKNGENKQGIVHSKVIWQLTKKYDKNDPGFGKQIDVYIETINKLIPEYLVYFEVLKKKLQKYNIVLVKSGLFDDIYTIYEKEFTNEKRLGSSEKTFSFLNRYWIFQKKK